MIKTSLLIFKNHVAETVGATLVVALAKTEVTKQRTLRRQINRLSLILLVFSV